MKVPLLDLKSQYNSIKDEIRTAIDEVLETQHFILGPKVTAIEEAIAEYSGSKFGVGVSSGSDALLICLMAEGIGAGDEVITTPYTFFATAGAISRTGARPVFADIQPENYNIAPDKIVSKITSRTRAIIPVHLYGQSADMEAIMEVAEQHGLKVIEDAAQAIGAECILGDRVRRVGSIGDYGCFSFFPSKNLGGFGDGGMVVVNDQDRAKSLRILRVHGSEPKYYHKLVGGNFRLDALQAAVLSVKMRYLDAWTASRQQNAAWYDDAFRVTGLVDKGLIALPKPVWRERLAKKNMSLNPKIPNFGGHYHIYHQYVINTPRRNELNSYLTSKGVGSAIYYPLPLHLQECFADLGYQVGSFPVSEAAAKNTLALPMYPELTLEQRQYVVDMVVEGLS